MYCLAQQYFSTLSHKWRDFRQKVIEHKTRVSSFSTTCAWNIFHSKKKWARYDQNLCIGLYAKYPLFLVEFNETWILLTDTRKIIKCQISWKCLQWEPSCSMWTDRRRDMTKIIVAFRYFAKAPKTNRIVKAVPCVMLWTHVSVAEQRELHLNRHKSESGFI